MFPGTIPLKITAIISQAIILVSETIMDIIISSPNA